VNLGGTIATGGSAGQDISLGDTDTAVSLTAATVLSAGGGNITLGETVAGGFSLTLNSIGTTTLGGVVGGGTPLASITTNAGGTTHINTTGVTTTGTQTYNDAVTLGADTTLTGTTISFGSTVGNTASHILAITGNAVFSGTVGAGPALTSLTVSGTTAINGG
jgi:hypothetical protein